MVASPPVTVISPLYEAARFVGATIESVLEQSFEEWEYILVDDCSSDSTASIARRYANADSRITLLQNTHNLGPSATRNRAILAARGRYLAFLDSDDLWTRTKLSEQFRFMKESKLALTYTAYTRIDDRGNRIGLVLPPSRVNYRITLSSNHIACSSAMYDTAILGKALFPDIRMRQDHALWLKLLRLIDWAYGIDEPLLRYRVRRDSLSANKLRAASYSWRLLTDLEQLRFPVALYHFGRYALSSVTKRIRARYNHGKQSDSD